MQRTRRRVTLVAVGVTVATAAIHGVFRGDGAEAGRPTAEVPPYDDGARPLDPIASDVRTGTAFQRFRSTAQRADVAAIRRTNLATGDPVSALVVPGMARMAVGAAGHESTNPLMIEPLPARQFVRRLDLNPK